MELKRFPWAYRGDRKYKSFPQKLYHLTHSFPFAINNYHQHNPDLDLNKIPPQDQRNLDCLIILWYILYSLLPHWYKPRLGRNITTEQDWLHKSF